LPNRYPGDALPHGIDEPDTLMTRHQRKRRLHGPVAAGGVDIRVADTRRLDVNPNLTRPGFGDRALLDSEWFTELANDSCTHRGLLVSVSTQACSRQPTTPRVEGPAVDGHLTRRSGECVFRKNRRAPLLVWANVEDGMHLPDLRERRYR
jgi:hypothetical protein